MGVWRCEDAGGWMCGLDVGSGIQGCREVGVRGVVVWCGELLFEISQRRISNCTERREDVQS